MNSRWLTVVAATFALVVAVPGATKAAAAKAATQRAYYGSISDSMCGAKHMMANDPRKCTLACVKGGAKYVLVTDGRVVKITNQNFSGLEQFAGEHVKVTGTRRGDAITISHIAPVRPRKRK